MDITIKGKNCDVSDDLELYTERKLAKLTKLNRRLQDITVTYIENSSKKRDRSNRIEVVANVPGQSLRAEEEKETFYIALDGALDKLRRQLKKLKTKRMERNRSGVSVAEAEVSIPGTAPQEEMVELTGPTVFVERFSKKPISTPEAILQLKLNDRQFMLFVNEQGQVNCVYKRKDGGFGLLVAEDEVV